LRVLYLSVIRPIGYKMLIQKCGYWYYQRRVLKKYAHIDSRRFVKKALRTKSIDNAIAKRNA